MTTTEIDKVIDVVSSGESVETSSSLKTEEKIANIGKKIANITVKLERIKAITAKWKTDKATDVVSSGEDVGTFYSLKTEKHIANTDKKIANITATLGRIKATTAKWKTD